MATLPERQVGAPAPRVPPRGPTPTRARILFDGRSSSFDCVVRNISSTGALLTVDEAANLPKAFDVVVGEESIERPARLVYRRGMLAGIRFLDAISTDEEQAAHFPAAPAVVPAPLARHDRPGTVPRITPDLLPKAIFWNLPWAGHQE